MALPAWARTRIEDLERRQAELLAWIEQLSAGPDDSNVRVRNSVHPDRPLGRNAQVAFDLGGPGQRSFITVEHSAERPGTLEIRVVSDRTGMTLLTAPVVSNHIRLTTGPA